MDVSSVRKPASACCSEAVCNIGHTTIVSAPAVSLPVVPESKSPAPGASVAVPISNVSPGAAGVVKESVSEIRSRTAMSGFTDTTEQGPCGVNEALSRDESNQPLPVKCPGVAVFADVHACSLVSVVGVCCAQCSGPSSNVRPAPRQVFDPGGV